jgi:hypothetical protein
MDRDPEHIRDEFSPLLDGELSAEERAAIEARLAGDADLLRELEALKRVDQLYRSMPTEQAPAGFEERVRRALQEPVAPQIRRFRPRFALWTAVAAAAGLLVVVGAVLLSSNPLGAPPHLARSEQAAREKAAAKQLQGAEAPSLMADEAMEFAPEARPNLNGAYKAAEAEQELKARSLADTAPADESLQAEVADKDMAERRLKEGEELARPRQTAARNAVEALVQDEPELAPLRKGARMPASLGAVDEDADGRQGGPVAGRGAGGSRGVADGETPAPPASVVTGSQEKEESGDLAGRAEGGRRGVEQVAGAVAERARVQAEPPPPPLVPSARHREPAPEPDLVKTGREAKPLAQAAPPGPPQAPAILERVDTVEKKVAGRTFVRKGGVWRQKEYRKETTVSLVHGGQALRKLVTKYKELAAITRLEGRVIFRVDDTWYELAPLPPAKKPDAAPPGAGEPGDR